MSTYRLDKLFAPRSVAVVGASPAQDIVGPGRARKSSRRRLCGRDLPRQSSLRRDRGRSRRQILRCAAGSARRCRHRGAAAGGSCRGCRGGAQRARRPASSSLPGLVMGPVRWPNSARRTPAPPACAWSAPIVWACWCRGAKFNASFAASSPLPGDLALISQSGAIAAGLVEWAAGLAASAFPPSSLSATASTSISPTCSTYFAMDRGTRAILLYIELIRDARKFMSAARAAARVKPVLVIKSGRHAAGRQGRADPHRSACRLGCGLRCGVSPCRAVARARSRRAVCCRGNAGRLTALAGNRLAILTNGGGIGVLAVDRLADFGGELADISPGDDEEPRQGAAADLVARQSGRHCRRCRRCPLRHRARATAGGRRQRCRPGHERADGACVGPRCGEIGHCRYRAASSDNPLRPSRCFAVWVGGSGPASDAFEAARIPSYGTEADAVGGFMHLVRYKRTARRADGDAAEFAAGLCARHRCRAARSSTGSCAKTGPGSTRWS